MDENITLQLQTPGLSFGIFYEANLLTSCVTLSKLLSYSMPPGTPPEIISRITSICISKF